jgi:hypothetical protein
MFNALDSDPNGKGKIIRMSLLPLNYILGFPPAVQILYFLASFVIAIAGMNRKMGFWGYLFSSILFSPVIGLMLVLVSEKRPNPVSKE